MNVFSKKDPEYQSNGHYIMNGVSFMSIYTYRQNYGWPMVCPEVNKQIGLTINPFVCEHIETIPDYGPFEKIKAYDLAYLKRNEESLFGKEKPNKPIKSDV